MPIIYLLQHPKLQSEELGWHFDNSSFAVMPMIQPVTKGGAFEYARDVRNADAGDMGFEVRMTFCRAKGGQKN